MSTDSWTRLTQSSRWGSFQARYRLCLVEARLAPRLAGSDSPPRSHVPWNGSRRADNPDTLLCQVSDASLQAPIRLLESTIPLTGPVALTGPPRFITAEASGCVFGTRTSPPRMVGENRQVYRFLVRFEAHAVERLAPYFTPAPVVVSRRPVRSHGPLLLFTAPGRCFGTVSFHTQSRLWTCYGLHVTLSVVSLLHPWSKDRFGFRLRM